MSCVLVDLDGTLCDVTHRKHILEEGGADRWERYALACGDDEAVLGVVTVMRALESSGWIIVCVSGRSAVARDETFRWLDLHGVPFTELWMRAEGERMSNVELKRAFIDNALERDLGGVGLIVDDHEGVIEMAWNDYQIPGLHVVGRPPYGYQKAAL